MRELECQVAELDEQLKGARISLATRSDYSAQQDSEVKRLQLAVERAKDENTAQVDRLHSEVDRLRVANRTIVRQVAALEGGESGTRWQG